MFCWIQIPLKESLQLEEQGLIAGGSGYKYEDEKGLEMVEHHVDCCHLFQDRMNETTEFGGNLSMRMNNDE
jgi:hypothetical protein